MTVPAPDRLVQASGNLLLPSTASGAVRAAAGTIVTQGAVNGSNVDLASEMSQMMDAQESYSLASRAINIEEQMGQIAERGQAVTILAATGAAGPSPIPAAGAGTTASAKAAAYAEATAFERVLVGQLTQQLAASAGLDGQGGADGSGSDGTGGETLAALVPQALTSAIMADGGVGLAASLAPALERAGATATTPSQP